mmetsp:Transcript_104647/g.296135  ORF Transcript_104647/g.296135 Transcript_104647/m.296135 type:complete len:476 (+) Transcript_104647:114-1541(+)
MASSLDSAINQHLDFLKANNPLLIAGKGSPNHVGPHAGAAPQGPPSWTYPGHGGPGQAMPPAGQPPMVPGAPQQAVAAMTQPAAQPLPAGANASPGTVSVAVDNLSFRYTLSEADLRETFERWGPVQSIQVHRDGPREVGVVSFADRAAASYAQQQLHGHVCNFEGSTGALAVTLGGPEQLGAPPPRPAAYGQGSPGQQAVGSPAPLGAPGGPGPQGPPMPGQGQGPPMQGQPPPGGLPPHLGMPPAGQLPGGPPMPGMPQPAGLGQPLGPGQPPMGGAPPPLIGQSPAGAMPKSAPVPYAPAQGGGGIGGGHAGANGRPGWTCKIIIQAESLHPDFPTVQKIVGFNGMNIDHIRTQTGSTVQLRGRGSGQAEPDTGQELPDPMFLWLPRDAEMNGKAALDMSQDLLKSVYEEHQTYCQSKGMMHPNFLEPAVIENPESAAGPPLPTPPGYAPQPQQRDRAADWGGRGFHGKGPY